MEGLKGRRGAFELEMSIVLFRGGLSQMVIWKLAIDRLLEDWWLVILDTFTHIRRASRARKRERGGWSLRSGSRSKSETPPFLNSSTFSSLSSLVCTGITFWSMSIVDRWRYLAADTDSIFWVDSMLLNNSTYVYMELDSGVLERVWWWGKKGGRTFGTMSICICTYVRLDGRKKVNYDFVGLWLTVLGYVGQCRVFFIWLSVQYMAPEKSSTERIQRKRTIVIVPMRRFNS